MGRRAGRPALSPRNSLSSPRSRGRLLGRNGRYTFPFVGQGIGRSGQLNDARYSKYMHEVKTAASSFRRPPAALDCSAVR